MFEVIGVIIGAFIAFVLMVAIGLAVGVVLIKFTLWFGSKLFAQVDQ